jgi:hypothetical protein
MCDYITSPSIRITDSNGGVKSRNQVMDKNMENLSERLGFEEEMDKTENRLDMKTDKRQQNADSSKSFINYERVFSELLRELRLKAAQCELIRAFLTVSDRETEFEASNSDLARILYKTDGNYDKRLNGRVGYALDALQKWQEKHKTTLVQVVQKGGRENSDTTGKLQYYKTKYKFVLLEEINKEIHSDSDNAEAVIENTLAALKKEFVPAAEKTEYHPRHLMKKAKKTIFTKFRKAFEKSAEAGDDPVSYCQGIVDECQRTLNTLESERTVKQNTDRFIKEFESKFSPEPLEIHKQDSSVLVGINREIIREITRHNFTIL